MGPSPLKYSRKFYHLKPRLFTAAVLVQALASPPKSAYLQRYPLRDDQSPPPSTTTADSGTSLAPQSVSSAPADSPTPPFEVPPAPSEDRMDGDDGDDGPSTGMVVGSVAGVLAALVTCAAVAVYVIARRRKRSSAKTASADAVRVHEELFRMQPTGMHSCALRGHTVSVCRR